MNILLTLHFITYFNVVFLTKVTASNENRRELQEQANYSDLSNRGQSFSTLAV